MSQTSATDAGGKKNPSLYSTGISGNQKIPKPHFYTTHLHNLHPTPKESIHFVFR